MTAAPNHPPRGKLSDREVGILLEQLTQGVSQQQPLDEVFRALSEDLDEPRLQSVAGHLAEQLSEGVDIETASATVAHLFPHHMRGALAVGAKSGNLTSVLTGLSESELARKRMQRGLRSALAYPMFVLAFLSLVLLFMSIVVMPQFAQIFEDFEVTLPRATVFTFKISKMLPGIVIAVLIAWVAVLIFGFSGLRSRFLHWLRTATPLFGRTWIWSSQHEFATLMSTLTEQQLPLHEALNCTSESLRDQHLAWATEKVNERCTEGASLSQSLRESIHFDPVLCSLAEWGETNGSLPLALRQAAETYEQEVKLFTQFLQRALPPLMLAFVAATMFFMIASLIIPLMNLVSWLT